MPAEFIETDLKSEVASLAELQLDVRRLTARLRAPDPH